MNELSRHQAAQFAFMDALEYHRSALSEAMRHDSLQIDPKASARTLVRLARVSDAHTSALHQFEVSIRASLQAYLDATPKIARASLLPDAQFLIEHFDRFTEVPLTASPVKRVVSWARRKLRGAAKEPGDVD